MKQQFSEKRIPTLFALLLLVVGVTVSSFLVKEGIFTVSTASPDYTPQDVVITNITDQSFTVSYITADPTVGGVKLEADGVVLMDDRNQGADSKKRISHYVTVRNLKPETEYFFTVVADNQFWDYENNAYRVKTGPEITSPENAQASVEGTITDEGLSQEEIIIYFSVGGYQRLSALTNEDGAYIFELSNLRSDNLDHYKLLREDSVVNLRATRGEKRSSVNILYKDSHPVPNIFFGENYDFLASNTVRDASATAQLLLPSGIQQSELSVTVPTNGQAFIDSTPTFRGTAPANTQVFIVIDDKPSLSTTSNGSGLWSYQSTQNLSQGEHLLTVRTNDLLGIQQQKQVVFEVFPSGSIVTQSATPSATPTDVPITVTPTTAPTSTPVPAISSSPTPTLTPAPTLLPTVEPTTKPTLSPTPTITPFLTVTPTAPGSGGFVMASVVSVVLLLGGATLIFFL